MALNDCPNGIFPNAILVYPNCNLTFVLNIIGDITPPSCNMNWKKKQWRLYKKIGNTFQLVQTVENYLTNCTFDLHQNTINTNNPSGIYKCSVKCEILSFFGLTWWTEPIWMKRTTSNGLVQCFKVTCLCDNPCPYGGGWDGSHCYMGNGNCIGSVPSNTNPFIWNQGNGMTGYYYDIQC